MECINVIGSMHNDVSDNVGHDLFDESSCTAPKHDYVEGLYRIIRVPDIFFSTTLKLNVKMVLSRTKRNVIVERKRWCS